MATKFDLRLATYLSYNYSEVWLSELANSYGLVDRPAAESIPNQDSNDDFLSYVNSVIGTYARTTGRTP